MKVFRCTCRDRPVLFYENVQCGRCRRLTGFCADSLTLKPFVPADSAIAAHADTRAWADDAGLLYIQCSNWTAHSACNWMIPLLATSSQASANDCVPGMPAAPPAGNAGTGELQMAPEQPRLCRGCRLNEIIPDLAISENVTLWRKLEIAKRRCLYSLLSLELPVGDAAARLGPSVPELAFRFLADRDSTAHFEFPLPGETPVLTGHQDGVITINLAEADDIARTRMRVDMEEHYRTLLGHFRHESGHYYWDIFRLADPQFLGDFRSAFGDETRNYADAVQCHYELGPASDWQQSFVSPYASMHPWEDWAETWAHYLHIVDTLQTRQQFGEPAGQPATTGQAQGAAEAHPNDPPADQSTFAAGRLVGDRPVVPSDGEAGAGTGFVTQEETDFREMMSRWIDTSIMLNTLNRSMGLPDPYPFVLNREVKRKLRFVDAVIRRFRQSAGAVF